MEPVNLFTIGYESRKIDEFLDRLDQFSIGVLVDVREIPASRKPGFSKNKLKVHLESRNIKYVHAKELGSPKALRDKLYSDYDYDYFFENYGRHLEDHIEVVKNLYDEVISNTTACLMCMEREPTHCHRKVVAGKVKEIDGNGMVVKHI